MKNVDDIYRLSPMQQGLLFHTLGAPGTYVEQVYWSWRGELDVATLQRAWQRMVERHTPLRTAFFWEGMKDPLQAVRRKVEPTWRLEDWTQVPPEDQEARFAARLEADQREGFNLSAAPLLRFTLVKCGPALTRCMLSYHHLVMDGWSLPVCMRELFLTYDALSRGEEPQLDPARPYRDYIGWLSKQDRAQAERFWRERLAGFHAATPLAADRPAGHGSEVEAYGTRSLRPGAALSGRLATFTRQHQVTLSTLVQGAWALTLGRHSGQEDVAFGTVVSGRPPSLPGVDGMLGTFINTQVSRVRLPSDTSVLSWLKALQAEQFAARDYEYVSLVDVQGWSDVPRGQPLFESLVIFENLPRRGLASEMTARLPVDGFARTHARTGYPLSFVVLPDATDLELQLTYDEARFDAATVQRMLGHVATVLESIVGAPEARLADVSLLTPEERQQVLHAWNDTRAEYPSSEGIASLFESQARRTPDAIALSFEGQSLTYAQLDALSNQLARRLQELGVRPGDFVALSLERSFELVVSILAVLKTGAAYVPLEASHPRERLALMLQDVGARLLITRQRFADALSPLVPATLCLDEDWRAQLASLSDSTLEVPGLGGDSLAYVMFTSGSTGRPKGVCVPHRAVVRLVHGNRFMRFGPQEVFLQLAPAAFDASTLEVWGALLHGARLVLAPARDLSLSEVAALLREHRVTTLWLTAALYEQMVLHHVDALATVPQVLAGGDVLPVQRVREHVSRLSAESVLLNAYGPTENTTFSTTLTLTRSSTVEAAVSIGRPIGNSTAYVLDPALRPVPVGVPGELYVGGEGLAWGYLHQPALTAERFLPHPFSPTPGARLYRTGDSVRWRPDGTLDFLGRTDFQVKLRGFRIEPGEVEAAVRQVPGVREAVVLVREDIPGDKRLVAYVVPAGPDAAHPSPSELREHLRQRVPEYMVPAAFMVLEALPVNANGKVDRRALPAPDASAVVRAPSRPPSTDTERRLAALWTEVLNAGTVNAEDDFFALGGHSLRVTQLVSRVRAVFDVELPLRAVFEAPTLAALAARLDAANTDAAKQAPPLVRAPREGALPLSFSQQRLWFLDQLQPDSAFYNVPGVVWLEGELDAQALEQSLRALVERHEVLRTTFPPEGDTPVQVIHPTGLAALPAIDLTDLSPDAREAEARRLASEEAGRPFNLKHGPVLRVTLLRLEPTRHALLVTLHHIVSDGWSLGVMVRELAAFYRAFTTGQSPNLPTLPVQYADFAVWQRQWLQGDVLDAQLDFWRQQLAGAPAALELPTDRPRPAIQSFRGASLPVRLPRAVVDPVQALAQQEGATPFMVLLASFQLLLSRYSGQQDVSVGAPIANRNRAETEGLIGFFVNSLVLRARIDARASFRTLLRQVKQSTLAAYEHQDVPFEKLVEALQPQRDLSRSPLFQVIFALQNAPMGSLALPGLSLKLQEPDTSTAKFDLDLNLQETPEGLAGSIGYSTDLFDTSTITRMVEHFGVLLSALCARPDAPLASFSLLTGDERQRVLVDWNATARDYPREPSLAALFSRQAALTPDAIALVQGEQVLTYAQLDLLSNQVAHPLRVLGVGPGSRVALSLERSFELVVSILAILKAGGAYVPLDASLPRERLGLMIQDVGARILLTQERFAASLSPLFDSTFLFDADWRARLATQRDSALEIPDVGGDSLAYVMFTSGSTGRPKGVCIPQRAVTRLVRDNTFLRFGPQEVFLQLAPVAFDASTLELWGPLLHGARLVLPPPHALSLEEIAGLLRQHRVSSLFITTALFAQLVQNEPEALANVSQLMAGGEAMPLARAREHLERMRPGTRFFHVYGPTENTTFSTSQPLEPGTPVGGSLPIGRSISNSTAYVLDPDLQPVPVGVPGELYVGGEGLAWGYLQQPTLTAERFLPDPFGTTPGARLYRTGDKVRWLADGALDFLGRTDFQVKLRGFRIEPGEIEAVLRQVPGIRDAIVLVREDSPGDKRLVAYVVPSASGEAGPTPDTLRTTLKQHLPEYMVPAAFVLMDALPLNANNKVDRKALPVPDAGSVVRVASRAPETDTERQLAVLWADVLKLDTVGAGDDFFALGGHSLLATQLVSRLRAAFGVELPLRTLFEAPTLEALAARIDAMRTRALAPTAPPLVPVSREGALPLSFAQQRLWFLDQLEPGSTVYNVPGVLRLEGELDTAALQQALDALVRRHEVLRTTFAPGPSGPVQRIAPPAPCVFERIDLESLSPSARELRLRSLIADHASRPFDLARGPLFRAVLVRLTAKQHALLVLTHHIASDGWSVGVMVREFAALYRAISTGEASNLPALPVQYADFAVWQRQWLQGDVLDAQLDFWRQQLADAPAALELPTDRPRPAIQSFRGASLPVSLSAPVSRALKALAQQEGATPFMVLLASFQLLLSRYSGQQDISVGSPIANRNRAETEGLIGFFVNTLVLRARIDARASFRALLRQVKRSTLAAYEHQDVPFEKLVEALQPQRDASRSPFFQVSFALQNAHVGALELPGLSLKLHEAEATTAKFDLDLNFQETADGFTGSIGYGTDLFDASTVTRMMEHFGVLLDALCARPDAPLSTLSLLAGPERQRVLVDWNKTRATAPVDDTLPSLFESHVQRAPSAVAVEHEGQRLTYAELDSRANQLAHHLKSLGLPPEARVGLCVERGLDLMVGLLGILKAGGCYVPLEPAYPRQRLAYMFQDSGVAAVVTQQALRDSLPEHSLPTVCLDSDAPVLARQSTQATQGPRVAADQLAYVLYTSGSTGLPKGVGITHRSIVHLVRDTDYVDLGPADCMAQVGTPSFDAATFEIWGALLNGARLAVIPRDVTLSPRALAKRLKEVGATTALLTTALFHQVAREVPSAFEGMRYLFFGGEKADARAALQVLGAHGPRHLVNLYGPTEATVCSTSQEVAGLPPDATAIPIGGPLTRMRAYVLDAHGQPVPTGVPGELYLGGVGLARGYLGQPALTAERFVPDAFSDLPGARLYRTGDRARWNAHGTLDFVGRVDAQVKLRGFRIEPAEVEAFLLQHPQVREAVVLVREQAPGDHRLVAYVVATVPEPDTAALRAFLTERLPAHMVPSAFVSLPALPLTPNGKLDRHALPAPDARSVATASTPAVPESLTLFQQRIAALFGELLNLERVGLHDDFFALGGHSLLATQLVSRVRSTFGVELPLRTLFDASTVARLTGHVEALLLSRATTPQLPPLRPVRRDADLPLSFSQQRLWVVDQLQPGGSQYNIPVAIRLEGTLDVESLRLALEHLVARHESLRTTFALKDGQPVQQVHPASTWTLPLTDLGTVPPEAREAEAHRVTAEEASASFDLGTGPLLRTRLLRLDAEHHVLLLNMHHVVSDGWSMGVLVREVAAGYAAFSTGKTPSLPPLPVQYADFAAWQRQWLQGDVLSQEVTWWKEQLAGAPRVLELLTDKPRPAMRSSRGGLLPVHLPLELTQGLLKLARQENATPFMALLALWQVLLSRYTRQEELLVGSPVAGRRHGELEGLVGFFVNTLVLRGRVRGRDSFRALLAQVRDTTLAAYEHQDLPFEKLVEELQPQRDLSRNPLVQVILALQNAPQGELKAPGLTLRPVEVENATARFDLGLLLSESPDGLRGVLEYSTDLFEPATAVRMAGHLRTLLESVVSTPEAPLSTLEWLTPPERQQLLVDWNATDAAYPRDASMPELFEQQVALRPDAMALEFEDERLTYAQLDARANQMAHLLREHGIGLDSLVAVCLERSTQMVVSLLAILKAGGAYVPLDAAYPTQRLTYMLEDAPPRLLITTRALRPSLPVSDALPCLFVEELRLDAQPTSPTGVRPLARNLAYVDFTSGSTGRPKGVAVEHRGVLRLMYGAKYVDMGPEETLILMAPISFDISTMEVWAALLTGSKLAIFPPVPPTDLELLGTVLRRHAVTTLYLSTGLFSQIVDVGLEMLRGVRQVIAAGDILSPTHTRKVLDTLGIPVVNGYGPTEGTVFANCLRVTRAEDVGTSVPIGPPISNTQVYILDAHLRPVPVGVPGELCIGGDGLARGYLSRPDLTAERFVPDAFGGRPGERLYRTGDLARWRPDGAVDFLGRIDTQVKVRGFRIELSEVEAAVMSTPGVREAIVLVREDVPGDKRLVAYAVPALPATSGEVATALSATDLREHLRQRLPEFMVPSAFVVLPALPLNPNGKVDRKALPAPTSTGSAGRFVEPGNPLEEKIAAIWARELGLERVGVHDHFFEDLAGTSLSVVRVSTRLREELKHELPVVWLFEHPTVHGLALRLERESGGALGRTEATVAQPSAPVAPPRAKAPQASGSADIAIIGMAGRFPGAGSVEDFWKNLREGVESISRFTPEELEHLPGLPEGMELWQHPGFVPAGGVLDDIDQFDHAFFDMSLREAQWTDPQQRLFLQCTWAALEDAGIEPEQFPGDISLYAGANDSGYAQAVQQNMPLDGAAFFELYGTATHQSLAQKTSWKLGLRGESTLVYTACSTGLVAVHLACQNLLAGLSDVALAGATRLSAAQRTGYVYQEGLIFSPDGHCRAFDAKAKGTISGNGVAAVVLKRLDDAVRDGDSIYAVIRATATNNDGRDKSGFTAPSVQGQSSVITQALSRAGVQPKDIGYVEAHGTATPLGDPIEVAALQRAYGLGPEHRGTIALASLKTNMGHLDTVAGLAGLMKAALALHHGEIPPSLHFEKANPQIDFDAGPFFVNTTLRPWPAGETPRRAAVSSFGVGGTNAHAVLEEAPMSHSGSTTRSHQVVLLSARTPEALEAASQRLATHAEARADLSMADVGFTHAVGRKGFDHRRTVVARDAADLAKQLRKPYTPVTVKDAESARRRRVAFVFPGQGAQQVGMGRDLYEAEPAFRAHLDACLVLLEVPLRERVTTLLQAVPGPQAPESALLADTRVALPALFAVEVSLARMWMDWGVRPHAVLGHSFGEYAAACVAGVLSLEDALKLAVARGELMHRMPPGAMLAVALSEAQVVPLLKGRLTLAAHNSPDRCVVSGPVEEIERLQEELKRRNAGAVRMPAPHAFHSADVEPLMPELAKVVGSLGRAEPTVRYVSGLTGTWARPGELGTPRYWADQMRQPVRFTDSVGALLEEGCSVLLEVGPGQDLTPLMRACFGQDKDRVKAVPSVRRGGSTPEHAGLLASMGELWTHGLALDWKAFYAHEQRLRIHLPTYPFQRKRVWVEASRTTAPVAAPANAPRAEPVPAQAPAPVVTVSPSSQGTLAAPLPDTSARTGMAQPAAVAQAPEPAPLARVPVTPAAVTPGAPARADAPRGDIEERVAALWRERLALEFVGRDDNFLEIGGNSLMAAQLLNQLRDTFGVQVPLAALFEAPTVAGIAARIEPMMQQAPSAVQTRELPLEALPRTGELPLSFVQERVWRLEQHLPGLSAYNIPVVLKLEGPAAVEPLERAIQEIVRRHEALRTTYDLVDGRPVQRFHPHVRIPLERVELTGTPEEREAEGLRLAREDAARPFDLVNGPVLRTTLVRQAEDVHLLLVCIHHVVCDTLSIAIFIHELSQLYGAFRQGKPSPLAPLTVQYADFGAWQRRTIAEHLVPEQEQWWRTRLAGMPRQLGVPTDRPRPEKCPLTSERMSVAFTQALARELVAFGKREGFTGYMTVLAAWNVLLHRYTGQTDIIVGTPIANRTRPELLSLIGYVAHSAAFRTSLAGDPSFRELLERVRQEVTDAQARPDVPFEYLVEQLVPGKDIGRDRMADTVFVYHSNAVSSVDAQDTMGVRTSIVEVPGTPVQWGTTLSDLTLILSEGPAGVHGALEYATELFDASTARRMLEHLQTLLTSALATPDERLSRLSLATEVERNAWPRP
ncbi:amino acid adenylation domain-containing protein, partial [Corallococcus praedator]